MNRQLVYKVVLYTLVIAMTHAHGYYSGRSRGYAMGMVHAICEIYLKSPIAECDLQFDIWHGKIVNKKDKS